MSEGKSYVYVMCDFMDGVAPPGWNDWAIQIQKHHETLQWETTTPKLIKDSNRIFRFELGSQEQQITDARTFAGMIKGLYGDEIGKVVVIPANNSHESI